MAKFHITPSGQARECSAKTPASCKYSKEAGEVVAHYDTKEEARTAYEKQAEQQHSSVKALSKKSNKKAKVVSAKKEFPVDYKEIAKTQKLFNNFQASSDEEVVNRHVYNYLEDWVGKRTPEQIMSDHDHKISYDDAENLAELTTYNNLDEIRQVNYCSEVLMEKNDQYYRATFSEDLWNNTNEFMNIYPLKRIEKDQIDTDVSYVSRVDDPEIVDLATRVMGQTDTEGKKYLSQYMYNTDDENVVVQELSAPGDSSFVDAIPEVEPNVSMYENEEKQNAREMETGVLIFDKTLNKGFIHSYMTASDGYGSDGKIEVNRNGDLVAPDGNLYIVKGIGTKRAHGFEDVKMDDED